MTKVHVSQKRQLDVSIT